MVRSFRMDPQTVPPRVRWKPATLVVLGLLGAAICLEITLRMLHSTSFDTVRYDQATGLLLYRPNATFTESSTCFENAVRTNAQGFHARPIVSEKGKDVFRIVVIGSSFVEAAQVPREQSFAAILEEKLNAMSKRPSSFEVIPIGFAGNGTYLDMMYYADFGAALKPDLVIDLTTEYELSRNASGVKYPPRFDEQGQPVLRLPNTSERPWVVGVKNILRKSSLLMTLISRMQVVQARAQTFLSHPTFFKTSPAVVSSTSTVADAENVREWDIEKRLLTSFSQNVKKDHAIFFLASWATPYTATSTADELRAHLAKVATSSSFDYLDLIPAVTAGERAEGKSATWSCDGHWNEDGHRWVAEGLFQYLQKHPALIRRSAP